MNIYEHKGRFELEGGGVLEQLQVGYHTWGNLNEARDNVIWICHALTANSDAASWWPGMVGEGMAFDTSRYFVVCANFLGSCYGTTGPLSVDPQTGQPYYHSFPFFTIRDMVSVHRALLTHLGIRRIALLAGGSMGGYQVLEWALMEPARIGKLFLIATSAKESPWGIAIHTAQRLAIEADSTWGTPTPDAGAKGLKAARGFGMITYRSYNLYSEQQTDPDPDKTDDFKAASYISYQGDKLVSRFNAYSYWMLTKAMDSFNIERGRGASVPALLATIQQPSLVIGINSDYLCPPEEHEILAAHLPHAKLVIMESIYGHDGFLVETEIISAHLRQWLGEKTEANLLLP